MRADPKTTTARRPRAGRTRWRERRSGGRVDLAQILWAPTSPLVAPLTRRERLRLIALTHLLPLGLYLLLAVVATYPLIRHFGLWLPSDSGDALQNYRNYWWTEQALAAGQNPYWTPLLYAPYGAPLYLHTLNLFNGLVSIPLQLLFGLIPAYNTIVFLSLTIGDVDRGVPLPYALIGQIPLLNIARVPNRLALVVTLCLAVLAGLALVALRPRFGARLGGRARLALTVLLAAVLLAEHLAIPFPMEAVSPPAFYQQLAASSEPGTILEIPYCKQCSITNYRQTVHERPVIGGYISRRLVYPIRDSPLFREILPPGEDMTPGVPQAAIGRQILAYAGVRWIVIIRDDPDYDPDYIDQFLSRFAEPTPLYEDAGMAVYRPTAPPPGIDRFIAPVSGWQEAEHSADTGSRMRWFAEAGTVEAWNFSGADRGYTLRFDTASYRTTRRLEIMFDDHSLGQWTIDSARQIAILLTLSPGSHLFTFRSLDPSQSPNDVDPQSDDDRQLSIAVANLNLNDR